MTMRAVWYEKQGPATEVLVVGEVARPRPGAGDVLVELHASGVNPSDVKQRGGAPGRNLPYPRVIPHNDGAGVIVDIGPGVDRKRIGERVWLYSAQQGRAFGTAAEFVTIPGGQAVLLPGDVSFAEGAGLGVPALTACQAVTAYRPVRGRNVLITGASGAVGAMAIEIAAAEGGTVFALVRSPEKRERAIRAGAHHILPANHQEARAMLGQLTAGRGIDLAIDVDLASLGSFLVEVIATNGTIVSYGSSRNNAELPVRDMRQKNVSLHGFNVYRLGQEQLARHVETVSDMLRAGRCRPIISDIVPLDDCAHAHEQVEAGAAGKVVLNLR